MKCPKCGSDVAKGPKFCKKCGTPLQPPRPPLKDEARAQVLATLVQSQDSVTWLAFSLAMTAETVLLAAFVQNNLIAIGRTVVTIAGLFLALSFWAIVHRSNVDMKNLYDRAAVDYRDTFHFPKSMRSKVPIPARCLMDVSFVFWLILWIVAYTYTMNPFHLS